MKRDAHRVIKCAFWSVSVVGWLLSAACATEPLDYVLPDPDTSLNPSALSEPQPMYGCNEWLNGGKPSEEKVFVDVSFGRGTAEAPDDHPTAQHIAIVTKHGGEIVYKFHVPAVRAWIATNEIPALSKEVRGIFRVANLRRYDWAIGVGYLRPYSYKDGEIRYVELGGQVNVRFDVINGISGVLPDRSVRTLRDDPNVDYVESRAPYEDPECS